MSDDLLQKSRRERYKVRDDVVGVSLKDLAKPSKINGLQAESKGLYPATKCNPQ